MEIRVTSFQLHSYSASKMKDREKKSISCGSASMKFTTFNEIDGITHNGIQTYFVELTKPTQNPKPKQQPKPKPLLQSPNKSTRPNQEQCFLISSC